MPHPFMPPKTLNELSPEPLFRVAWKARDASLVLPHLQVSVLNQGNSTYTDPVKHLSQNGLIRIFILFSLYLFPDLPLFVAPPPSPSHRPLIGPRAVPLSPLQSFSFSLISLPNPESCSA
jgi:hypothetical protein